MLPTLPTPYCVIYATALLLTTTTRYHQLTSHLAKRERSCEFQPLHPAAHFAYCGQILTSRPPSFRAPSILLRQLGHDAQRYSVMPLAFSLQLEHIHLHVLPGRRFDSAAKGGILWHANKGPHDTVR